MTEMPVMLADAERAFLRRHIALAWVVAAVILAASIVGRGGDQHAEAVARVVEPTVRAAIVPGSDSLYFAGDVPCEDDCSGHYAGWRWATRQRVTAEHQCAGSRSNSFREGCKVYLWAIGRGNKPTL
jgi:hypothetical protein